MPEWLHRVGARRKPADLLGTSSDDDVADPIGGPSGGSAVREIRVGKAVIRSRWRR